MALVLGYPYNARVSFGRAGQPVFLAGMMGSGKSTVGRVLAERTGALFVDLDARIERVFGRTVAQLFEEGEPRFRARERDALSSLLAEPGFRERAVVVALGGGAVIDPANRDAMHAVGTTVYLRVSPRVLAERLDAAQRAGRPLLGQATEGGAEDGLTRLLAARQTSYDACRITVDAEPDTDTVASQIIQALSRAHD